MIMCSMDKVSKKLKLNFSKSIEASQLHLRSGFSPIDRFSENLPVSNHRKETTANNNGTKELKMKKTMMWMMLAMGMVSVLQAGMMPKDLEPKTYSSSDDCDPEEDDGGEE